MTELRKQIIEEITGFVSEDNSTNIPLPADTGGADHIFTGAAEEIKNVASIFVTVFSDVDSAESGLDIQQSSDGTNWDHTDPYSIFAGSGKNYQINPNSQYFRIIYTNGTSAQSAFRLQTIFKSVYSTPSSVRIGDSIRDDDDAQVVKAVIASDSGDGTTIKNINVQHPLAVDGEQVFEKDVDQVRSTSDGFTGGEVIDLVNDNYTVLINSTATNPKIIYVELKRPLQTSIFGFATSTGNFSNTKITATIGLGVDAVDTVILDESADNTKKTTIIPDIVPTTLLSITIEFYTADACSVSALIVSKSQQRIARLQAQKPDETTTNINATSGGNLKISLEELESGISSNANSQLNVTQFQADGTEGQINYVWNNTLSAYRKLYNDGATNALMMVDYAHHEIHSGNHFFNKDWMDLTNAQVFDILLVTPDTTKWSHFLFTADFESEANVILYAGTTTSADGTPMTVINRNGNSGTANTLLVYHTPTVSAVGSQIARYKAGSGKQVGGEVRANNEQVLTQNTKFLARITNDTATNNWFDWLLDWYEHTDET